MGDPRKEEDAMARLAVLSPEQIEDPELRSMLKATGDEMFGVYGHCPDLFKTFLQFYRPAKYGGRLPFALKELVRLKIAGLNDCQR
jgi:hypothetical protein